MVRWIIYSACLFILLWAGGLLLFYTSIPEHRPAAIPTADAIVVLTGGRDRINAGVKLLSEGYATKLLVSGVGYGVHKKELIALQRMAAPSQQSAVENSAKISLGYEAYSTATNARETRRWMRRHHLKSLILVTANYHMPRSRMEFAALMPDLTIYPVPVNPSDFEKTRWWSDARSRELLFKEYHKFLLSWCRIHIWDDMPV